MSFSLDLFTCFQGTVESLCSNQRLNIDNVSATVYELESKKLAGELNTFLNLSIKFLILALGTQLSEVMLRGLKALGCALTTLIEDSWMLWLSVYFFTKQWGWSVDFRNWLQGVWDFTCTCNYQMNQAAPFLGISTTNASLLDQCSEAAEVSSQL